MCFPTENKGQSGELVALSADPRFLQYVPFRVTNNGECNAIRRAQFIVEPAVVPVAPTIYRAAPSGSADVFNPIAPLRSKNINTLLFKNVAAFASTTPSLDTGTAIHSLTHSLTYALDQQYLGPQSLHMVSLYASNAAIKQCAGEYDTLTWVRPNSQSGASYR